MRYSFILTGLIVLISFPLYSQQEIQTTFEDTVLVYEDLFGIREPMVITMKFNVKEFQKSRRDEKYHPAEMTCHVNDTFQVTHPVRVRARGKFRRDYCTMPPFWLNIRFSGIEAEELAGVNRMKVVTRCRGTTQCDNYVLREYLVYQIFNLLSPYSFNTRLVRLKYVDTGRKNKVAENWAFIIEPEEMMAERNSAMAIKSDKLSIRTVNKETMDQMAFFHYMIGHGDYSVTGRHNLKILTLKDYGPTGFIPVPYDFDYTGLVDAHYAVPGESLGISSVRERYYLGACRSKEIHEQTVRWLASYQGEIKNLITSFKYMDEVEKLEMVKYLESYFKEAGGDHFIERRIAPTCR
ncbi:MAG: hypothetical protein K8R52_07260 [Bacteroidales bacterium]|nr:hypothetical protein [Bacteroidales bacterium]